MAEADRLTHARFAHVGHHTRAVGAHLVGGLPPGTR